MTSGFPISRTGSCVRTVGSAAPISGLTFPTQQFKLRHPMIDARFGRCDHRQEAGAMKGKPQITEAAELLTRRGGRRRDASQKSPFSTRCSGIKSACSILSAKTPIGEAEARRMALTGRPRALQPSVRSRNRHPYDQSRAIGGSRLRREQHHARQHSNQSLSVER
jgi:hypothetical protein